MVASRKALRLLLFFITTAIYRYNNYTLYMVTMEYYMVWCTMGHHTIGIYDHTNGGNGVGGWGMLGQLATAGDMCTVYCLVTKLQ